MKKLSRKRKEFLNKKSKRGTIKRNKKYSEEGTFHPSLGPYDIFSDVLNRSKPIKYMDVNAPQMLILKDGYAESVIHFINQIRSQVNKGFYVNIRLDDVIKIGSGAIAMILSTIKEMDDRKIAIRGTKPDNEDARDFLECSGFFEHLNGMVESKNKSSRNKILTTGDKDTQQEKLTPEVHKCMETVWGEKARCQPLFAGLSEIMRNVKDHAFPGGNSVKWHLGMSHEAEEKSVKISFVDNGEGIIETTSKKGVWSSLFKMFDNNADILKEAFEEGIDSNTGLPWRGKGLPTIFEMYTENVITNLVIISNDVYLDFDNGISKVMNRKFSGTYYYFVVNQECAKVAFPLKR